jgi:hypothetical protein
MKRAFAVAACLLLASRAHADDHSDDRGARDRDRLGWYVPDFARLGSGGYLGLANIGVGYAAFNDVVNWSVGYGFTPAFVSGRNSHTFDMTLNVRPLDFKYRSVRVVPIYVGGGLLFGTGAGYFLITPARYRKYDPLYYPPTAVHWTANVGLEVDWLPSSGFFERHGAFVELRTMDTYFVSYLQNKQTLGLHEVFSTGIGYRAAF